MSYTELISTMTISSDVPTNVNENFRTAHFLNSAAKTAVAAGRVVTIFKVDAANDVIIDADGSETINGATTVTMSSQYNYRTIFSNGTEWFVISSS